MAGPEHPQADGGAPRLTRGKALKTAYKEVLGKIGPKDPLVKILLAVRDWGYRFGENDSYTVEFMDGTGTTILSRTPNGNLIAIDNGALLDPRRTENMHRKYLPHIGLCEKIATRASELSGKPFSKEIERHKDTAVRRG